MAVVRGQRFPTRRQAYPLRIRSNPSTLLLGWFPLDFALSLDYTY